MQQLSKITLKHMIAVRVKQVQAEKYCWVWNNMEGKFKHCSILKNLRIHGH